jgi:hypothetical protein
LSNDQSNQPAGRPRSTGPTSPLGSTVAIIVAVAAVIAGFLILRSIREPDSGSVTEPTTTLASETTLAGATTLPPTTTTPPLVTEGSKVQVVNATTQNGVAGQMTELLAGVGYQMAEPTNLADGKEKLAVTEVLYNADVPASQPVAESVARTLGGVSVAATGLPLDTASGAWPDADTNVLVMLGADLAGKPLPVAEGAAPTGEDPTTPTDPTVPTTTTG